MTDPIEKGKKLIEDNLINGRSPITTNQLRKILSAVNILQNRLSVEEGENNGHQPSKLPNETVAQLKYLEARIAYQEGRIKSEKNPKREVLNIFRELRAELGKIGESRNKFEDFARMVESMVAYHKFYGGKD